MQITLQEDCLAGLKSYLFGTGSIEWSVRVKDSSGKIMYY